MTQADSSKSLYVIVSQRIHEEYTKSSDRPFQKQTDEWAVFLPYMASEENCLPAEPGRHWKAILKAIAAVHPDPTEVFVAAHAQCLVPPERRSTGQYRVADLDKTGPYAKVIEKIREQNPQLQRFELWGFHHEEHASPIAALFYPPPGQKETFKEFLEAIDNTPAHELKKWSSRLRDVFVGLDRQISVFRHKLNGLIAPLRMYAGAAEEGESSREALELARRQIQRSRQNGREAVEALRERFREQLGDDQHAEEVFQHLTDQIDHLGDPFDRSKAPGEWLNGLERWMKQVYEIFGRLEGRH